MVTPEKDHRTHPWHKQTSSNTRNISKKVIFREKDGKDTSTYLNKQKYMGPGPSLTPAHCFGRSGS